MLYIAQRGAEGVEEYVSRRGELDSERRASSEEIILCAAVVSDGWYSRMWVRAPEDE